MNKLNHAAARPRSIRLVPRYPRHAILLAALSLVACGGPAPQATAPTGTVGAPNGPNDNPPLTEPPPPPADPPEDDAVPLAGVAPEPFEP